MNAIKKEYCQLFILLFIFSAASSISNSWAGSKCYSGTDIDQIQEERVSRFMSDCRWISSDKALEAIQTKYKKYSKEIETDASIHAEGESIQSAVMHSLSNPEQLRDLEARLKVKHSQFKVKLETHRKMLIRAQGDVFTSSLGQYQQRIDDSRSWELSDPNDWGKKRIDWDSKVISSQKEVHQTQLNLEFYFRRAHIVEKALETIDLENKNKLRLDQLQQAVSKLDKRVSVPGKIPNPFQEVIRIRKFLADVLKSISKTTSVSDPYSHQFIHLRHQFKIISKNCEQNRVQCWMNIREAVPSERISNILKQHLRSAAETGSFNIHEFRANMIEAAASISFDRTIGFSATLLDPSQGVNISSAPPRLRALFTHVIQTYFDQIHLSIKTAALAAYFELHPNVSQDEKIFASINHAGPALQKLFQLFGNKVKTPRMKHILNRLKSGIHPMTDQELDTQLNQIYETPRRFFTHLSPLATASIGEAHFAQTTSSMLRSVDLFHEVPKEVPSHEADLVLKIKKVGVDQNATHELCYFDQVKLAIPGVSEIVDELKASLQTELDFVSEGEKLMSGHVYIDPTAQLDVVQFLGTYPEGPNPVSILMSKAQGVVLTQSNPDLHFQCIKGKLLELLLAKWLTIALFGNGFFHADLHAGNILVYYDPIHPENSKLTLIDFANAEVLTPERQEQTIKLILGIKFGRTEEVIKALGYHSKNPDLNREAWRNFIEFFSTTRPKKINEVLDGADRFEIPIPAYLVNFSRGKVLMEQQINEVMDVLRGTPVEASCGLRGVKAIFSKVFKENALKKLFTYKYMEDRYNQVKVPSAKP